MLEKWVDLKIQRNDQKSRTAVPFVQQKRRMTMLIFEIFWEKRDIIGEKAAEKRRLPGRSAVSVHGDHAMNPDFTAATLPEC